MNPASLSILRQQVKTCATCVQGVIIFTLMQLDFYT